MFLTSWISAYRWQPAHPDGCGARDCSVTWYFVSAYVSSPELTFGFLFALEDPERIAEVVRGLMERRTVSVFRLAHMSGADGPPERYVVNWAAIPQIAITISVPDATELLEGKTMLINAFLGEGGEISLYSSEGQTPR